MPRRLFPLALFVSLLAGCTTDRSAQVPGERVVGVSKQLNEFMYAIGADSVLVARDLTSLQPPAIRALPAVGYHRALSAEGILSMKPTLLLTDGNVGPDAVLAQLEQVHVPILKIEPGKSVEDAQGALVALGKRFHREAAADSVIAAWRAGMARVLGDSAARRASRAGRAPRVLLMHFGQLVNDYLAVNRGSAADQMIRWAGGENAMDSIGGMTRLTPELIAKAAPDLIIATDVGFDRVGSEAGFATLPGVALTPAARAGRIHRIDESEIMYFGPRTPASLERIAGWIQEAAQAAPAAPAAQR